MSRETSSIIEIVESLDTVKSLRWRYRYCEKASFMNAVIIRAGGGQILTNTRISNNTLILVIF